MLRLFLADTPEGLGRSDLSPGLLRSDLLLPSLPTALLGQPRAMATRFDLGNSLRITEGELVGTELGNQAKRLEMVLPFSGEKGAIGLGIYSEKASGRYSDGPEAFQVDYRKRTRLLRAQLGLRVGRSLIVGGDIEKENDSKEDRFNWETVVELCSWLKAGLHTQERILDIPISAISEGQTFTGRIHSLQEAKFFTAEISHKKIRSLAFDRDINHPKTYRVNLVIDLGENIAAGAVYQKETDRRHEITFAKEGDNAGLAAGRQSFLRRAAWLSARPSESKRVKIALQDKAIKMDGDGRLSNETASIIDRLLSLERQFGYRLNLKLVQAQIGYDHDVNQRLTLRTGLQHFSLLPEAELDHWTPFPLFPIVKLDERKSTAPFSKMTGLGVGMGFTYRRGVWEVRYGIAQLIPLDIKKREEAPSPSPEPAPPPKEKRDEIDRFLKDYPGGNRQSLEWIWRF